MSIDVRSSVLLKQFRGNRNTGILKYKEVPHEDRQELLYCAGDKVLEQVAQRECGDSFPADIHETFGRNLEQHSLGYPVLTGRLV